MTTLTLLPEWHHQFAVLLAWPHADTDWQPWLEEIETAYVALTLAISQQATPLILCRDPSQRQHIESLLGQQLNKPPIMVEVPYNDTWCRDYGPLALGLVKQDPLKESLVSDGSTPSEAQQLLDFTFNGWGEKFDSSLDNQVNRRLADLWNCPLESIPLALEGGSVESDGLGTLLTTRACLLNANRGERDQQQIEQSLSATLGIKRFLWLQSGALQGDDTDSHIDNLARFADANTLVYASCQDPSHPNYQDLQAMAAEIQGFTTSTGEPYRTLAIDIPNPIQDEQGAILPASYVNFLILNQAVIVPTFDQPEPDQKALQQLQLAFPDKTLLPVPGKAFIRQFGGPHCATMQLPFNPRRTLA